MPDPSRELTVDHLFLLYRSSGRPRHLAQVFDRTAPELLRLAAHLAHDPGQAEDLVQSTFLEAMRSASRFRSDRRVLPWLVGILTNVARDARRKERSLPGDAAEREGPADPAHVAEVAELSETVDEELERLDEPYRTVLLLHLRHGMSPAEIARVVNHSPATVRSQLARGRARLQERLGGTQVQGLLVGWSAGRGLEALRGSVVRSAYRMAPRIWLASTLSGLASVPAVAAIVVVAGLGWIASRAAGQGGPSVEESAASGGLERVPAMMEEFPSLHRPTPQERQSVEATDVEPLVRVEVLVSHRGVGQADVGVRLRPDVGADGMFAERRAWTGPDGLAVFEGVAAGSVRVDLDRARGSVVELAPGSVRRVSLDLAERMVRGVVCDSSGAPLPSARIWIAYCGRADLGMVAAGGVDGQGRFELVGVGEDHFLTAFAPGRRPGRLMRIEDRGELEIVLDGVASILAGRVTDEAGAPIPDALVRIGYEAPPFELHEHQGGRPRTIGNEAVLEVRTDALGDYRFEHAPAGRVEVFVRARGRVGEHSVLSVPRAGELRHDVVLLQGRSLRGRVLDHGLPVPGAWACVEEVGPGTPLWFLPTARTDRLGEFVLEGVSPGGQELSVLDRSGRRVVGHGIESTWKVDFAEASAIRGRVLGPGGRPRPGLLVRPAEGPITSQRTDHEGRFRLLVPGVREVQVVDDRGPVDVVVARWVVDERNEREHVVHVDALDGARGALVGHLESAEGGAVGDARVRLRQVGALPWHELRAEAEAFRIDSLVPAEYELVVAVEGFVPLVRSSLQVEGGVLDLGTLTLTPGGSLTLGVTSNGRAYEEWVHLSVRDDRGRRVAGRELFEVGEVLHGLPPGRLEVTLWSWDLPIVTRSVSIVAGEASHLDVSLADARTLPFRVGLAPGVEPVGDLSLRLSWYEDGVELATDDHHFPRASRDLSFRRPLLPGRYELRARSSGGLGANLEFEVGSGSIEALELVLEHLGNPEMVATER